jgi:hypothetical protein
MRQIQLTKGKSVIVDDKDFDWLNQWKWTYDGRYAVRSVASKNGKRRKIYMHRLIANTPKGMDTDHQDMDRLNNQKANLRICTRTQNMMNRGKQKNNTTEYKGVHLLRGNTPQAQILINGKNTHIGTFSDKISAARAYDKIAREYYGEFAKTNFKEK